MDLILYGERRLHAIELKKTSRSREGDLDALIAFKADYPAADLYMFYGGSESFTNNGVRVIPMSQALQDLDSLL